MDCSQTEPLRAAVFDMDGLLLNTEDLYDVVMGELLEPLGREFTRECKLAMMGKPAPVALEILRERHQLSQPWQELASDIETRFHRLLPIAVQILPGVTRVLETLESQHIPKSVATSSPRRLAEVALREVGLWDRFDFVLCGEDVTHGKPAPDIYLESARRQTVPATSLIVFEDSYTGSLAASRASAYTVAVPGSHSRDQDFSHAQLVVGQIDDPAVFDVLKRASAS